MGYYLKRRRTHLSSEWMPSAAAPHVTAMSLSCNSKNKKRREHEPFSTMPHTHKMDRNHLIHTLLTGVLVGKSQTQISQLGDAPCPWWQQPPSLHHSEENWHWCDANDSNMVSLNQPPNRSVNYLLNEWLHAMECILNILIQLWVAWHLWLNANEKWSVDHNSKR